MTLYEFNILNETQQSEALCAKAVLVIERRTRTHRYYLYQVDDFYVEARYSHDDDIDLELMAFSYSSASIDPYLKLISLTQLGDIINLFSNDKK